MHGAGGGNLWTYTNLVPHLGPDQPVYALEARAMRGEAEFTRIEDVAAHYVQELRTVQPRGPYDLSGYCFGGNVACEMARQLRAQGEPIALLALRDSAPTGGGCRCARSSPCRCGSSKKPGWPGSCRRSPTTSTASPRPCSASPPCP